MSELPSWAQDTQQPSTEASLPSWAADQSKQEAGKNQTGWLGTIQSTALGAGSGVIKGVEAMGQLAHNINQAIGTPMTKKAGQLAEDYFYKPLDNVMTDFVTPQTEWEQQAVKENIPWYAAGQTAGDMATQITGMNLASRPLTGIIGKALNKIPYTAEAPVMRGAINQGIQGAGLGAVNDPAHPLEGAYTGGLLGAALGGVGGSLDKKLSRSGDVQQFEMQNAKDAGINPYSYEGQTRVKNALKANGADFAKYKVGQTVTKGVEKELDNIKPTSLVEGEVPAETLTRYAASNFKDLKQQVAASYAPLRANQQPLETPNLITAMQSVKGKPTISMPKLKEAPTFDDLLNYREDLRNTINKASNSDTPKFKIRSAIELKKALDADMLEQSNKIGLQKQFLNADELYNTQYSKFKAFRTDLSGKELSTEAMNDIMTKFNQFTQAKARVKLQDFEDIIKTLGPEGQKLMGWAVLEKASMGTTDAKGIINSKTLYNKIRMYDSIGVFNKLDPAVKKAAMGIKKIADGADEMVKQGTPIDGINTLFKYLPTLLGSSAGRTLLSTIGTSNKTRSSVREVIGQLIGGSLIIHKVQNDVSNEQNSEAK